MTTSMRWKANCWHNAPMEIFFGTLKTKIMHHFRFTTREQARQVVFEYIEVYYNCIRRHAKIGNQAPATSLTSLCQQTTICGIIQMTCPSTKSDSAQRGAAGRQMLWNIQRRLGAGDCSFEHAHQQSLSSANGSDWIIEGMVKRRSVRFRS
jgi:hypothetical protein